MGRPLLQDVAVDLVAAHGVVLELPSVGSAQHAHGQCKPCAHCWRPQGCFKGSSCEFCHICDETAWRTFRKKRTSHQRTERRRSWLNRHSGKHLRSEECELSSNSSRNGRDFSAAVLFDRDLIKVRKTFVDIDDGCSGSDVTGSTVRCSSSPAVLQQHQQQQQPQQHAPSSTVASVHLETTRGLDLVKGCPRSETDIEAASLEWLWDESLPHSIHVNPSRTEERF